MGRSDSRLRVGRKLAAALGVLVVGIVESASGARVIGTSTQFALLELRVTGNGAFFDDFEDGSFDTPPTSYFTYLGDTLVSPAFQPGGLGRPGDENVLAFTAGDGADDALIGGALADIAVEGIPIQSGNGNATVDATFRVNGTAVGESYGLGIGESDTYLPTNWLYVSVVDAASLAFLPTACAVEGAFLFIYQSPSFELGCDTVAPAVNFAGPFVLRFEIAGTGASATPSYSIDGGVTFKDSMDWAAPIASGAIWTFSIYVHPVIVGTYAVPVPEPSPGAIAVAALLGLTAEATRRRVLS
jgi:hypothetical protein